MTTATDIATEAVLRTNFEEFERLTLTARRHLESGRDEQAAVWAQIAANFAWMNHTGRFASSALEGVVEAIGDRLEPTPWSERPHWARLPGSRPRVLHVATQLYQTGGHTQAICCWMDQDAAHGHRVAVTRQGTAPLPDKIVQALGDPDHIWPLDRVRGGLLHRALALRAAARECDVVVMHTHNYDVVPTIAFHYDGGMPPIVLIDNNDHTFWLGRSSADVVMHMRVSGEELAWTRRGLRPDHSYVLERPLRLRERTSPREEAKARLGIPPDALVIVTAADGTKYRPVSTPSFLDLVRPVLDSVPQAMLVAAGPRPDGPWAAADQRTGGRVRALGMIPDVSAVHEAADVYVDSYPFSSLTSMLEAGSLGTPLLTYRGHPGACAVLGADTECLDPVMLAPTTPGQFEESLIALLTDTGRRLDLGVRTRAAILAAHTGAGWQAAVQDMYDYAASRPGRIAPGAEVAGEGELDTLVALVMQRTGYATGARGSVHANLGLLPLVNRLEGLVQAARRGEKVGGRLLLPEWVAARAAARRRGEARRQRWNRLSAK